ncbi:SGNH/GDSL hydrolase family protein [Anaerosacchariphilus polymeriproducens]|uniref:SGNH hydrolase n=1 Tax=Anaerosacchariphilus polymeriproducens TaxID=1812858 RepID=A0A371AW48_9FIRM|nr:SGNH/GDSL hydrolase family protein [Anaerosacchariphilus polymeriproducens]RDU23805.1 SGNH hydrolase [Anaerosacchariphilus polymeriproducens]
MLLEKNSRLLMIGDSITDCGRSYDSEPGGWDSFGDGYVSLMNAFFTALEPKKQIMVINKGISGDTILHLKQRWEKDVFSLNPDYISIMIGVNDVWRQFDGILKQDIPVTPEIFRNTYQELIEITLPKVKNIFLLGCFMIESNKNDKMAAMVHQYADITKELADKYSLPFIDVQSYFDKFLLHLNSFILSSDRVHPNLQGHMLIAKAFLDTIGFEWNKG